MPDYERYCRGVPGGAEAMACLSGRLDLLHPTCRRVVAANEPYMRDPRAEQYGYRQDPYGAPGGAPYAYEGRAPYGGGYQGVQPYEPRDGEAAAEAPRYQPYGQDPYGAPPQGSGRYAEAPPPQSSDRYAGDDEQRFQPYGQRYQGNNYESRGYGAPPAYQDGEDR